MHISLELLVKILEGQLTKEASDAITTSYSTQGPGRFDKWLMMEGETNCWQKRDITNLNNKKKKIIISDGLLKYSAPSILELEFISLLCSNYEVYLWPGSDCNFHSTQKVHDSNDYWENRHTIKSHTKKEVEASLTLQGIATDDYIIIDQENYDSIVKQLLDNSKDNFDSTKIKTILPFDGNGNHILPGIFDQSESLHKNLKLTKPTKEEISKLSMLPTISSVELEDADYEMCSEFIKLLGGKVKSVKFNNSNPSYVAISNDTFNKIEILSSPGKERRFALEILNNEVETPLRNEPLEELIINRRFGLYAEESIDLEEATHLKKLEISDVTDRVLLPKNSMLEEIKFGYLTNADYLNHPKLKSLILNKPFIQLLSLDHLTELENLEIYDDTTLQTLDLSNCHKLKSLKLNCHNLNSIKLPKSLIHFELTVGQVKNLDLTECPHLTDFSLTGCTLQTLKFNDNLENVKIINSTIKDTSLEHCKKIKDLTIENSGLNKIIDVTKNIVKVNTISGQQLGSQDSLFRQTKGMYINELWDDVFEMSSLQSLEVLHLEHDDIAQEVLIENCPKLKEIHSKQPVTFSNLPSLSEAKLLYCSTKTIKQLATCEQLKKLDISPYTSTLIQDYKNLEYLNINDLGKPRGFYIQNCERLKGIHINSPDMNSTLDQIYLKNLPALEELYISYCTNLNDLVITGCPNLKRLVIAFSDNIWKDIDLNQFPHLELLSINYNQLEELNLGSFKTIKTFGLFGLSRPEIIDLTHCRELETVTIYIDSESESDKNKPGKILLSNLPKLMEVNIPIKIQQPTSIDLSNNTNLRSANISGNNLDIDITNCDKLYKSRLKIDGHSDIKGLNTCSSLHHFNCDIGYSSNAQNMSNHLRMELPVNCQSSIQITTSEENTNVNNTENQQNLHSNENKIPLEQYQQHIENSKNPISTFSLDDEVVTDSSIGKQETRTTNGEMSVTFEAAGGLYYKNHYRIQIFDEIVFDKGTLKFASKPDVSHFVQKTYNVFITDDIEQKKNFVQAHPEFVCGYFNGTLKPGIRYPIPTRETPIDDSIDAYAKNQAIEIFWDPKHHQYYMQLKDGQPAQKVDLLYLYKRNPNYTKVSSIEKPVTHQTHDAVFHYVDHFLKNLPHDHELQFMNSNVSIDDKLQLLIKYCSSFKDEALSKRNSDTLLAIIDEKKGVCRHRSQAFMLLARYLGITTQMIQNENHAFCEVLYVNDRHEQQWHRHDLGGGFLLDLTQKDKITNQLDIKARPSKSDTVSLATQPQSLFANTTIDIDANPIDRQRKEAYKAVYKKSFENCVETNILHNSDELIRTIVSSKRTSPLFHLADKHDPFMISRHLQAKLPSTGQYLYIHNAKDFSLYLQPLSLRDGTTVRVKGPLAYILDRGGTVVVNWSNFTANEIASYKSILDPEPTLLGNRFNNQLVKIIGLTKPDTEACSAFSSRCKAYQLSGDLNITSENVNSDDNKIIEIDLYQSDNWREKLYGKIKYESDVMALMPGPLVDAINTNCTLVVKNPPNNAAFNVLKERLKEGRVLYNGEYLPVHPKFKLEIKSQTEVISAPRVNILLTPPSGKQAIYININNMNELYERLIVDADHKAIDEKGYLDLYTQDKAYFYITQSIPESDWLELLSVIKQTFPDKDFDFVLAPGISIQNTQENKAIIEETKFKYVNELPSTPAFIFSNDADFVTQQIYDQYKEKENNETQAKNSSPLIVDITPQTSFGELIASTRNENIDNGKVKYIYETKPILEALQAGRTVILNGDLSPTLYQQLLPLFNNPPHLISNGEPITFKEGARLVSVQSTNAAQNLPIYHHYSANYNINDYRSRFGVEEQHFIDQINQFYELANKIPGGGLGRPQTSPITFHRLKRMVNALKKRNAHPANPLKGIYHYDFPRDSEDYAYLNVIAKRCFYFDSQKDVNTNKIKSILARHKITNPEELKNHIWKILNCYSGLDLIRLLGKDLSQSLRQGGSKPAVTEDILNIIWNECQRISSLPVIDRASKHIEKRNAHLKNLLIDKETSLIFLKGEPGAGKTHDVRQLKNELLFDYYEGSNDIIHWLNASSNHEIILLLDEANMSIPGTWDFMKGLIRGNRTIVYQGKEYPLSDRHKVLFTGNPENFPERYYHRLFQDYAETIYYKMHDDEYLRTALLPSLLSKFNLDDKDTINLMIEAFHLIQDFNPTFGFSNRDLESLVQRFNASLPGRYDDKDKIQCLYQACLCEFAGTLQSDNDRIVFNKSLANKFNIPYIDKKSRDLLIEITPDCFIPQEKAYLVDSIEQDLIIRQKMLNNQNQDLMFYKQGVLIEGDPGLGKSFLLKSILEKHGFSANHIDPQKRYYEISAGSEQNAHDILLKAYHEGSAVILDEINLDETLEELLNQLLTGVELIKDERHIYISTEIPNDETLKKYANAYFFTYNKDTIEVRYVNRHGEPEKMKIKDITELRKAIGDIDIGVSPKLLKPLLKPDVSLKKIQELIIPCGGLTVFASQNPSYYKGRKSVSKALRNRMHMCYMEPYKTEALVAIAKKHKIAYPEIFVNSYFETIKKYGDKVNMRIFYTMIREHKPSKQELGYAEQQAKANAKKQFLDEHKMVNNALKRLKIRCEYYQQYLNGVINANADPKREAICELIDILQSDRKTPIQKLEEFSKLYERKYKDIVKERQEYLPLQFLKNTLRAIPINKLQSRLTRVEGQVFSSHIDKILERTDFPLVKYDTKRIFEILLIAKEQASDETERAFCESMLKKLQKFQYLHNKLSPRDLDIATASIRSEVCIRLEDKLSAYDAIYQNSLNQNRDLAAGMD